MSPPSIPSIQSNPFLSTRLKATLPKEIPTKMHALFKPYHLIITPEILKTCYTFTLGAWTSCSLEGVFFFVLFISSTRSPQAPFITSRCSFLLSPLSSHILNTLHQLFRTQQAKLQWGNIPASTIAHSVSDIIGDHPNSMGLTTSRLASIRFTTPSTTCHQSPLCSRRLSSRLGHLPLSPLPLDLKTPTGLARRLAICASVRRASLKPIPHSPLVGYGRRWPWLVPSTNSNGTFIVDYGPSSRLY